MPKLTFRKERSHLLDELNQDFDELLARMQTPQARTGVEAAFNASPLKLGRAAITSAQKHQAPARKRARRISTTTRT